MMVSLFFALTTRSLDPFEKLQASLFRGSGVSLSLERLDVIRVEVQAHIEHTKHFHKTQYSGVILS